MDQAEMVAAMMLAAMDRDENDEITEDGERTLLALNYLAKNKEELDKLDAELRGEGGEKDVTDDPV